MFEEDREDNLNKTLWQSKASYIFNFHSQTCPIDKLNHLKQHNQLHDQLCNHKIMCFERILRKKFVFERKKFVFCPILFESSPCSACDIQDREDKMLNNKKLWQIKHSEFLIFIAYKRRPITDKLNNLKSVLT